MMFVTKRIRRGFTIFGKDVGWFYDVYQFVPIVEPSKIVSEEKQIKTRNTIIAGIANNEKEFNSSMRLSVS